MFQSRLLGELVEALRCLPGVGSKGAQRMAFHLLERDPEGARRLSEKLIQAVDRIAHCTLCRNLSENEICDICASGHRDRSLMCVVETPADVAAIDQATGFNGLYFVLMGHLSPLDGIGPEELELDRLEARLDQGEVSELILATNPTVEGEATAHYISEMARSREIRATRIAHGVPLGGELGYVDSGTLSHAMAGRTDL